MSNTSEPKLKRNLTLWHIIIIGLAYIQPMTLFDTFGLVSDASHFHVPTSYIIALLAILLTSVSYGSMIRLYPSSGSSYTYAQKSIHPNVGFMVGWASWLDYLLSPMVNIILAKIYLTALFPSINGWFWVIGLTALMTGVNLFGAKAVAYFNSWIVFVQLIIIVAFTYLVYAKLNAGFNADGAITAQTSYQLWSFNPFWNEETKIGGLISGATILCFSFTGFDALSSLAEETQKTKKILPKGIVLTTLIAGIIFIISTYFIQVFFPNDPAKYFKDIGETQPDILLIVGGSLFQAWVLGFAIITVMASGISAHAGVSRLMYVMGRDGVINKKIFGHISPRLFTPTYNIFIAGGVALTAGFMGLDLVVSLISFGALTAFSFVHLSVLATYVWKGRGLKSLRDYWIYLIVPILGFISVFAMWLSTETISLIAGLCWSSLGFLYLLYKTKGLKTPIAALNLNDDEYIRE